MLKIKSLVATTLLFFLLMVPLSIQSQNISWEPAENPLMTRWAEDINPEQPLAEYPRPQMARPEWKNLNGLWKYAVAPALDDKPESWEGEILVPFGIESALSGVKRRVGPDNKLWYQRSFTVSEAWADKRVALHFGAVDWRAEVWVNGKKVGSHDGGYTGFSLDISEVLKGEGEQTITVAVWDPTDEGFQPRGKQVRSPESIWYTPTTGIWQTVWLEPLPNVAIEDVKTTPDIDEEYLSLTVIGNKKESDFIVKAAAFDNGRKVGEVKGALGENLRLPVEGMKLWSPDSPFLYDLKISLHKNGKKIDKVESYFGMREVRIDKAEDGFVRLFLNDEPLFHYGLLDQGFWPDGIYTAPTDEALKYDIQVTKDLGFNMIRKHVKVEPARWYYWADKIGVLVWQDMPNGDRHIVPGEDDIDRVAQSDYNFKKEYKELIEQFYNHPSIVTWVPFNEGWGQFQTKKIAELTQKLDPSRLVNVVSGWQDRGVSDMHDIHSYPGPDMPEPEEDRAAILGEFGGEALVVEGNLWVQDFSKAPSHYETSQSKEELFQTYEDLLIKLIELRDKGLAGAVYTQTTDVESEVNGIMTYDREIVKFEYDFLRELHRRLLNK
ncbi:MAG: beta galactosidase jelly roll domain-containing protein [Gracilimonas sp.]|uniref:glycoside hydrolase family 2 protein n=1 Tax=Gracilimonas sp. TaxID=1974203 RepID=UPI0019A0ED0C|nr:sugar-binding domain-containing protein [Gracilimonas sp.]MBD3617351.1 beta galactosidase jelly roll domain-containing protein [Gracilimonas sp.]